MCTWADLKTLTMKDLMDMHRSLNLKAYIEDKAVSE